MSPPLGTPPTHRETRFAVLQNSWRQKRRISELDVALTSAVSLRHLSFLDSGRAMPSRGMILPLSEALELPLRERNVWLNAAGFAPDFRSRPLDHPQMSQLMAAVRRMLANQEQFPAVTIDRAGNILLANATFDWMSGLLGADLWERVGAGSTRHLMRLFSHPHGIKPSKCLRSSVRFRTPKRCGRGRMRISLITVISTFGTAHDVTTDELLAESLFPADEATVSLFGSARTLPK